MLVKELHYLSELAGKKVAKRVAKTLNNPVSVSTETLAQSHKIGRKKGPSPENANYLH